MGLGDWVSSIFGSKNEFKAQAPEVNSNAYQYGGRPGGADDAANRYQQAGQVAQGRQAAQAGYGNANEDRANQLMARQGQAQIAQSQLARAMGRTPSIAGMQAQQDMQRAQAAQMAAAASARGPAALALAQQQAANNTANAFGQISGQARVNAAQERLAAEQAAGGQFANMRGGDLASQGQSAQQDQFNAGLQMQQRGLNDAYQLQMAQNEMGVRNAQLTAGMNQQAQQSANALGAAGINAGVGGQNAAMNQSNAMGLLGLGQSAARSIAGARAAGGPVRRGFNYLVGEQGAEALATPQGTQMVGQQGPEVVTPQQDGVVIPNHALRTWGTGPDDPAAQRAYPELQAAGEGLNRALEQTRQATFNPASGGYGGNMAIAGLSPGLRNDDGSYQMQRNANGAVTTAAEPLQRKDREDVALARAKENEGIELSEEEERKTNAAQGRLATEAKGKRKGRLATVLGDGAKRMEKMASAVDVGYHGPSGYQAGPQLLALPGRAMGGPVQAGQPYAMGEMGPELLVPTSGAGAPGSLARVMGPPPAPSASSMPDPLGDIRAINSSIQQGSPGPGFSRIAEGRGLTPHSQIRRNM